MNAIEEELKKHEAIRARGAEIGRKLMASKRQMQEEARRDMQDPKVQAIIAELREQLQREKKSYHRA